MWHIMLILCTRLLHVYADNVTCHTTFDFQPACLDANHGNPIQTHSNIASAIACSELCFENQDCRSMQFNPVNKQCLTNARRMTNVSTSCSNPIRYGEVQKSACRPYWMFDPCSSDGDCLIAKSKCRSGKCECEDGLAYDYRFDSCVTECAEYGTSLHEVFYSVNGYDDLSTVGDTLEQCQNRCFSSQVFVCRYIEYYETVSHCHLSKNSAITVSHGSLSTYPDRHPNWRFFDRNCA